MGNGSILFVDDEASILEYLQDLFGRDFTVLTAPDAAAALSILERQPVDVVVSDYKMPGRDGLSLLIEVKRSHPRTVRALMTAYADMQLVIRAMNEGEINRFIAKPCAAAEFRRVIEECLTLARAAELPPGGALGRTVLVAHESVISQAELRLVLTPAYQVITTTNGIEALTLLATRKVDAVILGVALELLDGCAIADYLRKEKRSAVPLVFWARGVDRAYEDYLVGCGADLVLDGMEPDAKVRLQQFLRKRFP